MYIEHLLFMKSRWAKIAASKQTFCIFNLNYTKFLVGAFCNNFFRDLTQNGQLFTDFLRLHKISVFSGICQVFRVFSGIF